MSTSRHAIRRAAWALLAGSALLTAAAIAKSPLPLPDAAALLLHRAHPAPPALPPRVRNGIHGGHFQSVPVWVFQFSVGSTQYGPEYVVGKSIFGNGGTARVNASIIPVRLRFPGLLDAAGKPYELDATADAPMVVASPNFVAADYASGHTQYQDAAQRASFHGYYADTWHTLLVPSILPTITIDVPDDQGVLYYFVDTGTLLAAVDSAWWEDIQVQVNAAYHIPPEKLPILLTHNMLTYSGDPDSGCCAFAWHRAYVTDVRAGTYSLQTAISAPWLTEDFGEAADVYSLSHEIAEWANDPFGINLVPRWDFPQGPNFFYVPGLCEQVFETTLLEVADPLENSLYSYGVSLRGFTYHLAPQATASWFARETPSSALHGAYGFPDESALVGPAQDCP